jgi:hypothetical protein
MQTLENLHKEISKEIKRVELMDRLLNTPNENFADFFEFYLNEKKEAKKKLVILYQEFNKIYNEQ